MKTLVISICVFFSFSTFASNCVELTVPLELGKDNTLTKAVNKFEQGHYAKKVTVKMVRVESVCEADKKGAQTMDLDYSYMADGVDLSCDAEVKVDANGKYDIRSLCEA